MLNSVAVGVDNFCDMVGPIHLPCVCRWVSMCDKTSVVSFVFCQEELGSIGGRIVCARVRLFFTVYVII